uniref:ISAs1 family transposase n=1 Tax=Mariniflexile sp. TaxID=1979402 RepID=UPI00404836FC
MTTNGPKTTSNSLFTQYFSTLKEPRRTTKGNFQYPLEEILFLTISSIISGWHEDWDDIIYFGENNLEWLRKFYPYKNGIPSHDVLNRLYNRLDTKEFNQCFMKWASSIATKTEGRVIPIDGKTVRGNASNLNSSKLHIVSAFCTKNALCLGQVKVGSKSNEITAIPELLDLIAVKGCIVTIDAMGCQRAVAEKIIDKKADYVLMVKENQAELKEQIEKVFRIQKPEKTNIQEDLGHGRIEKRTCEAITKLDFLDTKENWTGLRSVIKITSERTIKKTDAHSSETRYYISSLLGDAALMNNSIRSHWAIENNLHWSLDVAMKEDGQLNYVANAAENMNMMKKMALGMIVNEKSIKKSKAKKMKKALMDESYRELLLKV